MVYSSLKVSPSWVKNGVGDCCGKQWVLDSKKKGSSSIVGHLQHQKEDCCMHEVYSENKQDCYEAGKHHACCTVVWQIIGKRSFENGVKKSCRDYTPPPTGGTKRGVFKVVYVPST